MQLTNATFEFIEMLDEKKEISSLVHAFQTLIGKFGLTCFLIGDASQPKVERDQRLWATTWPNDWLERWKSRNYITIDPVLNQLLHRNEPVRWRQVRRVDDVPGLRVLDEASDFGLKDGLTLPVYGREGLLIGITLGTDRYDLDRQSETCLHMAAIYFHSKLEQLRAGQAPRLAEPRMTPREHECLSWVAAGKTDWEISQILCIAEQTVHEYVQNALTKLKATTRAQAVATAIFTKQIWA
jgi:LuxR family transcriptional regulator, quorum-sensing system regulator BjaR1